MGRIFFILLFCFVCPAIKAQDIHFSQFFNNPIYANPANTGNFNAEYRFIANERTQWGAVTRPYQTFALSADANKMIAKKFNTGFSLTYDRTGDSFFTTTIPAFSFSYKLNLDTNQTLFVGIQPTLFSQQINPDGLSFDRQYNGFFFDGSLSSNEQFNQNSFTRFNLGWGAAYDYQIEDRKKITVGLSMFNLLAPRQSFFGNSAVQQDLRTSLQLSSQWKISDKTDLLPAFYLGAQGKFREIIIGGSARYVLNDNPLINQAVYYGIYYRSRDAGYLFAGMDYGQWNVGLSYDLNVSGLRQASNGRGGLELSLRYLINTFKNIKGQQFINCPDFI